MDDSHIRDLTLKHMWRIGNLLSQTCAPVSRFTLYNFECHLKNFDSAPKKLLKKRREYCNACGNLFLPDNHQTRIHSNRMSAKFSKKLLARSKNQPWLLTRDQKKKLKAQRKPKIRTVCHVCRTKKTLQNDAQCLDKPSNSASNQPQQSAKYRKVTKTNEETKEQPNSFGATGKRRKTKCTDVLLTTPSVELSAFLKECAP